MSTRSAKIGRREFLHHSAAVVALGAVTPGAMLRDAVLRSRQTQKPVLTEAALNTYLQGVRARGYTAEQAFLTSVRTDARAFFRNNFTLTTLQDRGLTAFTTTDISTLINGVGRGLTSRNELRFRLPTPSTDPIAGGGCAISAKREMKPLSDGTTAEIWTVAAGAE